MKNAFLILSTIKSVTEESCQVGYAKNSEVALAEHASKTKDISAISFDAAEVEIILKKISNSGMFTKDKLKEIIN